MYNLLDETIEKEDIITALYQLAEKIAEIFKCNIFKDFVPNEHRNDRFWIRIFQRFHGNNYTLQFNDKENWFYTIYIDIHDTTDGLRIYFDDKPDTDSAKLEWYNKPNFDKIFDEELKLDENEYGDKAVKTNKYLKKFLVICESYNNSRLKNKESSW